MANTLVPKHEVLNAKEAEEVLEKYSVSKIELPRIKKGDAALKGISAKAGDIVKITRQSSTAGESPYYRLVTD